MSKKAGKVRRYGKPQFTEAQIRAFQARQQATLAARQAAEEAARRGDDREEPSRAAAMTYWGRVEDEYAMIRADLVRVTIISAAMFAIIIGLWIFLG